MKANIMGCYKQKKPTTHWKQLHLGAISGAKETVRI